MTAHVRDLTLAEPITPEPVEKPRSDTRRLIKWGCILLAVTFGGFGLWATLVPLRSAVIASGVVKVDSKRKAVQHLDGGILKAILVRENQHVEAGQLVAKLDTTQIEANLGVLETKLFADLAMDARLIAEQNGASVISFPEELINSRRSEAKAAVQTQLTEFAARSTAISGERQLIDQQIAQYTDAVRGLESNTESLAQQLLLLQEEIRDTTYLLDKGLARKPRVLALRRAEADMQSQVARNS